MTTYKDSARRLDPLAADSLKDKDASWSRREREVAADDPPSDPAHVLAEINLELARLKADKGAAAIGFAERGQALRAVADHPNASAYPHGGILATEDFAAPHVLPFMGFADLAWTTAVSRISKLFDGGDDRVLTRVRQICEQDAGLEEAGLAWCAKVGLLRNGKPPKLWLARPKLGLGQTAKFHGLKRVDVPAHRGIYALGIDPMVQAFATASAGKHDQSFGALLPTVIADGGERLHNIGAAALHADAETRYRARERSFAAHQATAQGKGWRNKPATSRQGHLAVATARALGVDIPAEQNRGDAADWLDSHDANLRFNGGEK